jgi:hypothetical protein
LRFGISGAVSGAPVATTTARPDPPAVGELEDVHGIEPELPTCGPPRDLGGQAELDPEFLGLRERASHQRLP